MGIMKIYKFEKVARIVILFIPLVPLAFLIFGDTNLLSRLDELRSTPEAAKYTNDLIRNVLIPIIIFVFSICFFLISYIWGAFIIIEPQHISVKKFFVFTKFYARKDIDNLSISRYAAEVAALRLGLKGSTKIFYLLFGRHERLVKVGNQIANQYGISLKDWY